MSTLRRVLIAVVFIVAACNQPATGGGGSGGGAAPAGGPPASVSGKGISKSAPFRLSGNYNVTWTAKADSAVGCYHGGDLSRADGTFFFESLANEILNDAATHTGSTRLYNVPDAQYYVNANSGCTWTFTFTPA